MVFEYIKRGWEVYKENLVSFIAAELILLLFVGLFGGVALWFIFSSLGISPLTELTDPTILIERIGSIFPLLLRLSFVFFLFLTGGLIDAFLKTGMYGMADEAFRGNTELNTLFIIAREKGLRGLSSSIILGMIFFVMMVILVGGLGTIFSLIGSLIGLILSFLIMIFFSLTFPALVVDDLSATEAIKQSFKTVKENYLQTFCLVFLYILLMLTFLIPFIGIFFCCFVIIPMMRISLVLFYKRNRYL